MTKYFVTGTIEIFEEIEAESPEEAAEIIFDRAKALSGELKVEKYIP